MSGQLQKGWKFNEDMILKAMKCMLPFITGKFARYCTCFPKWLPNIIALQTAHETQSVLLQAEQVYGRSRSPAVCTEMFRTYGRCGTQQEV